MMRFERVKRLKQRDVFRQIEMREVTDKKKALKDWQ